MLKIEIICVGKVKTAWINTGIAYYQKLNSKFARIVVTTLKEGDSAHLPVSRVLDEEGQRILSKIDSTSASYLLDVTGAKLNSEEFSDLLSKAKSAGRTIQFVIGGAFGVDSEIKKYCKNKLSLSAMTFPHEITQLLLLEQIYRGFSITAGSKYHK